MPRKRTGEPYKSKGIWWARISVYETHDGVRVRVRKRVCLDTPHEPVAKVKLAALLRTGHVDMPTLRELGERWTSGALAREHPDQVVAKRSAKDDVGRLEAHIYPTLGDKPIDQITRDDCAAVMRALPESAKRSRAHVAGTLSRLLKLAVHPLGLLERTPLPPGFVPKRPKLKAMAWLYPDEDARLLACTGVALFWRMLWGVLAREGMRAGEACRLTWADLDLRRGMVKLDKNKTDDPRSWALDPGVRAALHQWRALRSAEPPTALVFTRPDGRPHKAPELAPALREHLRLIGLEAERPELFETTDERQRFRAHDLRGTFVTINLALGKSEAWIADRTGHRSSAMIARYKRTARSFAELGLGALAPLDAAVQWATKGPERSGNLNDIEYLAASPTGFESAGIVATAGQSETLGPPSEVRPRASAGAGLFSWPKRIDPVGRQSTPLGVGAALALRRAGFVFRDDD